MGGSKQTSKPTVSSQYASGALTGYILGPGTIPNNRPQDAGAMLFDEAGQGIGIIPPYSDIQDIAGQSYFGNVTQDPETGAFMAGNPVLSSALNNAFTTPEINVSVPSIGGGGAGGFGGGAGGFGGQLIGNEYIDDALGYLSDTPSAVDALDSEQVTQLGSELREAYKTRALADMEDVLDRGYADLLAQGHISGSTFLDYENRVKEDILNDIAVFDANLSLENTKYLGDLAYRDILTQSNNMQAILQQAMVEKGIDADYAAQIAAIQAEQATALAVAQLNSQTQLALQQQRNAIDVLGLGLQDFANTQQNQLDVATLPIDTLTNVMSGGGQVANQSTKSI